MAAASSLAALAAVQLDDWAGLPSELTLDAARAELAVVPELTGRARLGARLASLAWVAVESNVYEGGLRLYVEGDRVVLVEARDPVTEGDEPFTAPKLGAPDLTLEDGELVFAARGLALQVSPGTDVLRAVLAFAPTTAEDYVERLRPEAVRRSRFPASHARRPR